MITVFSFMRDFEEEIQLGGRSQCNGFNKQEVLFYATDIDIKYIYLYESIKALCRWL